MVRRRVLGSMVAGLLLVAPLVAGCSSDTKDKAGDALESAGDDVSSGADGVQARATAEALRAGVKASTTADDEGVRSVKALEDVVADLPGSPEVSGIEDGDGDGLDDDGKVQVTVDEAQACVTLPATGEDTTVADGAC